MTDHALTDSLTLRTATKDDVLRYFEWANDPDVRRSSFSDSAIDLDTHRSWYAAKLSSPSVLLLVVELNGEPVGQIRFEMEGDVATIGFSLAATVRGRGVGTFLLRSGTEAAIAHFVGIRFVRGQVKPANQASRAAFERSGFRRIADTLQNGTEAIVYEREVGNADISDSQRVR